MKLIKMLTGALVVPFLVSCGGSKTATEMTPEEIGLNLVKITEDFVKGRIKILSKDTNVPAEAS